MTFIQDKTGTPDLASGLQWGPPGEGAVHLCIDMQRMFAEDTAWKTPWLPEILPAVVALCEARPDRICFTRFIPVARPEEASGAWRRYWRRWPTMTRAVLEPGMVDLVPELAVFAPAARVLDKAIYSPWLGSGLHASLQQGGVDTVIVTGCETDVCVLATVMGAVDLGYRTIVVLDAVCSSADSSHDNLLALYHRRFGQQIETVESAELLEVWR